MTAETFSIFLPVNVFVAAWGVTILNPDGCQRALSASVQCLGLKPTDRSHLVLKVKAMQLYIHSLMPWCLINLGQQNIHVFTLFMQTQQRGSKCSNNPRATTDLQAPKGRGEPIVILSTQNSEVICHPHFFLPCSARCMTTVTHLCLYGKNCNNYAEIVGR